jgi:hypothetical protein
VLKTISNTLSVCGHVHSDSHIDEFIFMLKYYISWVWSNKTYGIGETAKPRQMYIT